MKNATSTLLKSLAVLTLVVGGLFAPLSQAKAEIFATGSITASPSTISCGQTANLNWSSSEATTITISPGVGSVNPYGSINVTPTQTTIYTLSVSNTSGSSGSATATVNVIGSCLPPPPPQNTRPVLTLIGANSINVTQYQSYTDAGATAYDAEDGNITSSITRSGFVNTSFTGAYTLTYNVSDSQGLAAIPVYRTINVTPAATCQDTSANNYGGSLPCTYSPQLCQDPAASNYHGSLPCTYPPQILYCQDINALNYRGSLPCQYPVQILYCQDINALNYRGSLPCQYPQQVQICQDVNAVNFRGYLPCQYRQVNNNPLTIFIPSSTVRTTTVRTAANSLVLINSTIDRNQPIIPTLDNTKPRPGDQITYTVTYRNAGTGSVTNLTLNVVLPAEVEYLFSNPNNPTVNGSNLFFSLGTLGANKEGTVTIRVRVRDNIQPGTNLNFPAVLSYTDANGNRGSVNANVSAQVINADGTTTNLFGASVFGSGIFLPNTIFGWLLLLILILLLVLLAKYLYAQIAQPRYVERYLPYAPDMHKETHTETRTTDTHSSH